MDIWGRTPDIIEMQEGIPVYVDDATEENILDVCRNNMNEDKSSFTTLISKYLLIVMYINYLIACLILEKH